MYFVYRLLLILGFLILLPRFLVDALRHGKYVSGFGERLGTLRPLKRKGPIVWLHCVSVGESQAARPLVQGIRKRFPDYTIVVSTITLTGQKLAREIFKSEAARVFYFPFDMRSTVRRALDAINPSAVLIMETEIWPGFLHECQDRRIPVAIVNGRLSQQSFRRYRWIRGFLERVLRGISVAVMQTEEDAQRIRALGLHAERVFVSGNLKFDAGGMALSHSLIGELRQRFNLANAAPLIVAASTHAPEERLILEAFRQTRASSAAKPRLMLAPRHPERFAEVASMLEKSGLTWRRRTSLADPSDEDCDVILLDTIGELPAIYALGSVVFVGGSIAKSGGHNILEPAAAGAAIITGAHTHNFETIVKTFVKQGAIVQLRPGSDREATTELASVFIELLANDQRRHEVGRRARALVEQNLGATERTLKLLDSILTIHPTQDPLESARAEGARTA